MKFSPNVLFKFNTRCIYDKYFKKILLTVKTALDKIYYFLNVRPC